MMLNEFNLENTYHWPADGESRPWTEFWVTTFTRPVGELKIVSIHYSVDNGKNWQQKAMEKSCVLGDQDVWHLCLGCFAANTHIRYALEAINAAGISFWDNSYGKNHHALIGSSIDFTVED